MPKGVYERTKDMMTGHYKRTPEMLNGRYMRTSEMQTGKYERTPDMLTGKYERTEEMKKNMSEAQKGKKMSEETRRKMSESQKNKIRSPETRVRMSKALKGIKKSEEARKNISISLMGRRLSDEHRKNMSLSKKGKGKGKIPAHVDMRRLTELARIANQKRREIREENIKKGIMPIIRPISDEHRRHLSESHMGYIPTKEAIRKGLRRNKMSSLEILFDRICKENNLPYRFVGNGEVIIGRKCPDFININGEKKAIEVYYRKHKELLRGNVDEWKNERIKIFNSYGWELLFFDETQVKEDYILNILKNNYDQN